TELHMLLPEFHSDEDLEPDLSAYTLRGLPLHLFEASQIDRLHQVLADFDFLQDKIDALGPEPLISDYERSLSTYPASNPAGALVFRVLQMSAHILSLAPSQLASQLLSRLGVPEGPELSMLLTGARSGPRHPWLYPITGYTISARDPLLRTFT